MWKKFLLGILIVSATEVAAANFQVGITSHYNTTDTTPTGVPSETPSPTPTPIYPDSGETFGPDKTLYAGSPITIDEKTSDRLLKTTLAAI